MGEAQHNAGPRRVYLDSVGCRLNQAEIEQLGRTFAARGDALAAGPDDADLVVINTCAVTGEAVRKSRRMIRAASRANPHAQIAVTGCWAELDPAGPRALPGVTYVIGTQARDQLVPLVSPAAPPYDVEPVLRMPLPPGTLGRTRAFVKVQDGCDNRCTFCVTTIARGPGRSRPLPEVLDEVRLLTAAGYREIVLTGVHLGSYGHDLGDRDGLQRLIGTLLAETDIPRLRLSSLEPWHLTPAFFDLWSSPRLCPHLHLPLQSGSDRVLRRMARRTTQRAFTALVHAARSRIPDLAITTDIIVGFPAETDAEFAESLEYVRTAGFARLHVFSYSARVGTAAAAMPAQVPPRVIAGRWQQMVALSGMLWEAFQRAHLDRTFDVLWESALGATPEGMLWLGHTPNYLRVVATTPAALGNTITPAHIHALDQGELRAVPLL